MSRFTSMLCQAAAATAALACLPAAAQTGASGQGVVVVRDAETGQVRAPTAAEMRSLQAPPTAAARSSAARVQSGIVAGPGGRRSVQLDERHMVYSVLTRDAGGKHGEQCVKGPDAAQQALSGPATESKEHRHADH